MWRLHDLGPTLVWLSRTVTETSNPGVSTAANALVEVTVPSALQLQFL